MATSTKTKKDYLKEDLLKDPYSTPSLAEISAQEDPQEYVDAIKEVKPAKEESKRRFEKMRKMLEGK